MSAALMTPRAFRVFAIAFLLYCVTGLVFLYTWNDADYWAHAAAIRLFGENLVQPRHPFAGTAAPFYLYTPYHIVWAILANITSIPAIYLMIPLGAVNAVLFLIASKALARDVIGDPRYAFAVAVTMLFFWLTPWTWSGLYHFGQIPLTLTYSFFFTLPVALILLASYPSDRHGKWYYIGATPLMAVGVLAHPATGFFMLTGIALRTAFWPHIPLKRRLLLFTPLGGALLLAFTWPVFSLAEMLFAGTPVDSWQSWPLHIAPAWLGMLYVVRRVRERSLDFVSTGVLLFLAVVTLNYIMVNTGAFGRYVAYVALFLHLATVASLRELSGHRFGRLFVGAWLAILIVGGGWGIARSVTHVGLTYDSVAGTPPGTHSNIAVYREWQRFAPYLDRDDVVLAPELESWMLPAILGVKIVPVLNEFPEVADYLERRAADERFFSEDAGAVERFAMLDQFRVSFVVLPANREDIRHSLGDRLEYMHAVPSYRLFRVVRQIK